MAVYDKVPLNFLVNDDNKVCGWVEGTTVTIKTADGTIVANSDFEDAVGGGFIKIDDGCRGNLRFPVTQTSDFYTFEVVAPGIMEGIEPETTTWVGKDGVESEKTL